MRRSTILVIYSTYKREAYKRLVEGKPLPNFLPTSERQLSGKDI
jgi:hypothetical protein